MADSQAISASLERAVSAQLPALLQVPEEDLFEQIGRYEIRSAMREWRSVALTQSFKRAENAKAPPQKLRRQRTAADSAWLNQADAVLSESPHRRNPFVAIGEAFIRTNSTLRRIVCDAANKKAIGQAMDVTNVSAVVAMIAPSMGATAADAPPGPVIAAAVVVLRIGLNEYCRKPKPKVNPKKAAK